MAETTLLYYGHDVVEGSLIFNMSLSLAVELAEKAKIQGKILDYRIEGDSKKGTIIATVPEGTENTPIELDVSDWDISDFMEKEKDDDEPDADVL